MPTFTVVAGANGCGKTTLTRWAREEFQENSVLDPDAIDLSLHLTSAKDSSVMDAGREVISLAEGLLAARQSFTVETTSGNSYLRMMTRAKKLGYFVVLIYIGTANVEINIERVRLRVIGGGHDVSASDQRRRYPEVSRTQ